MRISAPLAPSGRPSDVSPDVARWSRGAAERHSAAVRLLSSSTSAPTLASGSTARVLPGRRWFRAAPAQRTMLWGSLAVVVGAFLPWAVSPVGSLPGLQGYGGLASLYAASLGIAGALVARPLLAVLQAAVAGGVAVAAAGLQAAHVLGLGVDGLSVGLGVPVTMLGGAAVLRSAVLTRRQSRAAAPA